MQFLGLDKSLLIVIGSAVCLRRDGNDEKEGDLSGAGVDACDFDCGLVGYSEKGANPINQPRGPIGAPEGVDIHGEAKRELDGIGKRNSDEAAGVSCDYELDGVVFVEEVVAAAEGGVERVLRAAVEEGDRLHDGPVDLDLDGVGEGVVDAEDGPVGVAAALHSLLQLQPHVVGRVGGEAHVVGLVELEGADESGRALVQGLRAHPFPLSVAIS